MILALLILIPYLAEPCLASEEDSFYAFTQAGVSVFTQALEVSRHFPKPDEFANNYFVKKQFLEEEGVKPKSQGNLPLRWSFGAFYSRITVPASLLTDLDVVDETYSVRGGLGWEILEKLDSTYKIAVDMIPAESYRHGNVSIRFEYTFSLHKRNSSSFHKRHHNKSAEDADSDFDEDEEDPDSSAFDDYEVPAQAKKGDDASEYYLYQRERKLQEIDRKYKRALEEMVDEDGSSQQRKKRPNYPYFKVAYNFGFNSHFMAAKVFSRKRELGTLGQNLNLFQYQNGPEITYAPNERWALRGNMNFYSYSASVDNFISNFEAGNVVGEIGTVGSAMQFLTFPSFSYSASADWLLNDLNSFSFRLNYSAYAHLLQGDTIDFNPIYYKTLGKSRKWKLGIGTDIMYDTTSSLPNPLSFVGTLELIYKL